MTAEHAGTPAGSGLAEDVGFLLSRAAGLAVRVSNAVLADHGLRVREYSVLLVACHGAGRTQRDLSADLGLDPSQVVALVGSLVDAGLVRRRADPDDRRTRVVVATTAGRTRCAAAAVAVAAAHRELFGDLDPAERRTLADLLLRVDGMPDPGV